MKAKVLIIEDEELLLNALASSLSEDGYMTLKARDGKRGFDIFKRHEPDIILLDVRLPDTDGMKILKRIKETDIEKKNAVIIMTAFSGIKGAVEAIKLGADDYIAKPFDIEELKIMISRCLESKRIIAEINRVRSLNKKQYSFDNIITKSHGMREIISMTKRISLQGKSNILLLGESGTGKELFAKCIHYNSPRANSRMMVVNCSTFTESLIESELFGYEKGSFTGATKQKKGYFEEADRGTVFLDEIGEINQKTQVKLLRFLEERLFQRVGGTEDIEVDVRVIAATNRDLQQMIKEHSFRDDLYYRLNVISITIPALRKRREDIPLLVNHYINEFNGVLGKNVMGADHNAINILQDYEWPGNVRELRNVIERAMLLCNEDLITVEDLTPEILNDKVSTIEVRNLKDKTLKDAIKIYAEEIMRRCNNNQTKAAYILGVSRPRLRRILNSME